MKSLSIFAILYATVSCQDAAANQIQDLTQRGWETYDIEGQLDLYRDIEYSRKQLEHEAAKKQVEQDVYRDEIARLNKEAEEYKQDAIAMKNKDI